jgi:DNA (cytosine-5)-methyltransferase 3A
MKNIISLFDGMSCGQIAINEYLSKDEYKWFASEIHYPSMNVTNHNFPQTVQLGDVSKITGTMLPKDVFMVMGGSPCTDLSIAGSKRGIVMETLDEYLKLKKEGFEFKGESYLFWEFVRIVKMTKPKYFFLENVNMTGKNKKWIKVISDVLGVQPIRINSSLVTAQNRDRLYWTNIPGITTPEDRNIKLGDIIEGAVGGFGKRGVIKKGEIKPGEKKYYYPGSTRKDSKANCLTKGTRCAYYKDTTGNEHKLTIEHCEVLQGVPVGYTNVIGVCKTDRYAMLGNGWTVPVIEHLFSKIPEFELVEV